MESREEQINLLKEAREDLHTGRLIIYAAGSSEEKLISGAKCIREARIKLEALMGILYGGKGSTKVFDGLRKWEASPSAAGWPEVDASLTALWNNIRATLTPTPAESVARLHDECSRE